MNHTQSITSRRMSFNFDELPNNKYFFDDNSLLSTLMIALSTLFPDGERFFVKTVRAYQDKIADPQLKQDVRGFIGQEAHHGNCHEVFNDAVERKWHYPIKKFLVGQAKRHELSNRFFSDKQQLAMTVGLEHLTAILAEQILSNPELIRTDSEALNDLFLWHASEEIEHKSVAFDLYQSIGGDEATRIQMMLLVTFAFSTHLASLVFDMHLKDGHIPSLKESRHAIKKLWGKQGILRKLTPEYLAYFKKDFHPWQNDNRHLIDPSYLNQAH